MSPYRDGPIHATSDEIDAIRARYARASLRRRAAAVVVVFGALAVLTSVGFGGVLRDIDPGPPAEACEEDTMTLYSMRMRLDSRDEPAPRPPPRCVARCILLP